MILIDAHIHIHECFDLVNFFDSAKENFIRVNERINSGNHVGALCLTESYGIDYFLKFYNSLEDNGFIKPWKIYKTNDDNVLIIEDNTEYKILIIAGRQIVTEESLEVLAIGMAHTPNDGGRIKDILHHANQNRAIPIIPWGVGKWSGKRGSILENLIDQKPSYSVHLGDNGNRPWFWPKSKIFEYAKAEGMLNLPGSDPLPFRNEENKAGSFGFIINGEIDFSHPYESLFDHINSSTTQYKTYGRLESTYNSIRNQLSMQLVKRKRK